MPRAGQTGIVEQSPNAQTIKFGDNYICLTPIAKLSGITKSHLSRVFSGDRNPSLAAATKIASAMGISLNEFVACLEERKTAVAKSRANLIEIYTARIDREDTEDLAEYEAGRVPAPRLPALRSA